MVSKPVDPLDRIRRSVKIIGLANAAILAILLALVVVGVLQLQGIHNTQCSFKHNLEDQQAQAQEFLDMTPEERVDTFGPAVGSLPVSVIRSQMANRKLTLDSLSGLHC